jgi:hypothetical protein
VIEGLGWVFEFRLKSLIAPVTFGIPLLMTLGLLRLYRTTRHSFVLAAFAGITVLWWVLGIGLFDGLYNHTLNLALSVVHAPPGILKAIYPSYTAPATSGPFTMACDGVQYSYCAVTTATVFYEVAGIASFVVACWLALDVYRLVRRTRRDAQLPQQELPRRVLMGVSLGMVASFGTAPMLGMYMASGKPAALVLALAFMAAGIASLAVATAATRARPQQATTTSTLGASAAKTSEHGPAEPWPFQDH